MDWLSVAKSLPYGSKIKIQCCSTDNSMAVHNDSTGYWSYCHRCKNHNRHTPEQSFARTMDRLRAELSFKKSESISLPRDFSTDWTKFPSGLVWLLMGGLTIQLIKTYGIGFSLYFQRVVIPVKISGTLRAVLMRAVNGQKPKYLIQGGADDLIFYAAPRPAAEGSAVGINTVVVTEDILSAIKVAGSDVGGAALLGTSVTDAGINALIDVVDAQSSERGTAARIACWLDNDKAGHAAAAKFMRRAALQGIPAVRVTSERDPKKYQQREIKEILCQALS